VVGLRSSGLHTNGYSLVRRVLIDSRNSPGIEATIPGSKTTLGKALLAPHRSYRAEVESVKPLLRGISHITGGGFEGNISRLLPKNVDCIIEKKTWKPLPVFELIRQIGKIQDAEMYRVFNMGIGMVLIVRAKDCETVIRKTRGKKIGEVVKGKGKVILL
jgi:phosphoribosylformylglycinamidine cyclo-ligase